MIPTMRELEAGRYVGYSTYGYFYSFCEQNICCEDCDRVIRFGCVVKRKIEELQMKRILKICKQNKGSAVDDNL